jgi:hypothetical protein
MPYVTFDDGMREHFLLAGFILQFPCSAPHSHRSYSGLKAKNEDRIATYTNTAGGKINEFIIHIFNCHLLFILV